MTYHKAVKPHIDSKLTDYSDAMSNNNERQAFAALEDAHVIGQHSTYYHCLIHCKMLRHGLLNKDWTANFLPSFSALWTCPILAALTD